LITVFTGRGALFSGGRQVLIGAAAAALTYLLGSPSAAPSASERCGASGRHQT
jgi:hypothetical protein